MLVISRAAPLEIGLPFRLSGHAHLKFTRHHRIFQLIDQPKLRSGRRAVGNEDRYNVDKMSDAQIRSLVSRKTSCDPIEQRLEFHTFRSDVSDREAIATLYEKVAKQFPEPNILINNADIMREINAHDKAGSLADITREIEINLSGPIRMVKQFLPHLKKIRGGNHERFIGIGICSNAHFTGLLRHQGRSAFVCQS